MSSFVQLITSQSVMNSSAQSLKIPTVQTKKIIRMSHCQISSFIRTTSNQLDQTIPTLSPPQRADTLPCLQEKPCGLFNPEIDEAKSMDTDSILMEQIILNNTINNTTNDDEIKMKPKSKFSKRLSEANLRLNLKKPEDKPTPALAGEETPFNLDLDDLDLKLITPNTEKLCFQYLQSMPSGGVQQSARIISNIESVFESMGYSDVDLEKLAFNLTPQIIEQHKLAQNPFLCDSSADLKLNESESTVKNINNDSTNELAFEAVDKVFNLETVTLDHGYSNKRKISSVFDENSMMSQDSFSSSLNESMQSAETRKKKQRTRGIYRAEDVTNEEELLNYIERRKKNNISSKVSRANKKNFFSDMDNKSNQLENENEKLKGKIVLYEELNKTLKEYLIHNFSNNLK